MNACHVPDTMLSMADRIVSKWSKYFLYKRVYRLLKWRKNNTHTNTHTHTHTIATVTNATIERYSSYVNL